MDGWKETWLYHHSSCLMSAIRMLAGCWVLVSFVLESVLYSGVSPAVLYNLNSPLSLRHCTYSTVVFHQSRPTSQLQLAAPSSCYTGTGSVSVMFCLDIIKH